MTMWSLDKSFPSVSMIGSTEQDGGFGLDGYDIVAASDEMSFIFELLLRIGAEHNMRAPTPMHVFAEYFDASPTAYPQDSADFCSMFFATEGSGIIINQVPTFLPPEVSTAWDPNFGFLDPQKPFGMGTHAQTVVALPNFEATGVWREDDPDPADSSTTATEGTAYIRDHITSRRQYTTKDLGGGWTWWTEHAMHPMLGSYTDGNFFAAMSINDSPDNVLITTSTFVYEAMVVNWFDDVALRESRYGASTATEYGMAETGTFWFEDSVSHPPAGGESDGITILPEGVRDTYYSLQRVDENIAFQSESVTAISPYILAQAFMPDGSVDVGFMDPADRKESDVQSITYAEWPWMSRLEETREDIQSIWLDGDPLMDEDGQIRTPVNFGQEASPDILQPLVASLMMRWRTMDDYLTSWIEHYGERHYYNSRVSAAVDELGDSLYYSTLPSKFILKAQPAQEMERKYLSAMAPGDSSSVSPTSDSPTSDTTGTSSGGSY